MARPFALHRTIIHSHPSPRRWLLCLSWFDHWSCGVTRVSRSNYFWPLNTHWRWIVFEESVMCGWPMLTYGSSQLYSCDLSPRSVCVNQRRVTALLASLPSSSWSTRDSWRERLKGMPLHSSSFPHLSAASYKALMSDLWLTKKGRCWDICSPQTVCLVFRLKS